MFKLSSVKLSTFSVFQTFTNNQFQYFSFNFNLSNFVLNLQVYFNVVVVDVKDSFRSYKLLEKLLRAFRYLKIQFSV